MTPAERKREQARLRVRRCAARKKAGVVRLVLYADQLWLAEVLYQAGGFASPDEDTRASLEASTQRMLNFMLDEARAERLGRLRVSNGPE